MNPTLRPIRFVRPASLLLAVAAVTALGATLAGQTAQVTDSLLFDDGVLQRVEIQVNQSDWDTLRANYTKNTFYPAAFVWRGQTVRNVGIRSRGSGTRNGQKPGLLVDFNRYVDGQTFLGLSALVLDNNLQDPSAMREALAMAIHRRLGLPAPREAHAELFINGQFFGVYNIVENVDSTAARRMFPAASSSAAGSSATIRGIAPSVGDVPQTPRTPPRTLPPSLMGPTGYLFEYKWIDEFNETYLGFDLDPYAARFEAKTHEDEPAETLYRPIEALFREINDEAATTGFAQRVGRHLDLALYLRLVAVESYLADRDGIAGSFGANNFYLYRRAGGGPHVIIPWDEDNAFSDVDADVEGASVRHVLVRKAMQVPELRALFRNTIDQVIQLTESRAAGQNGGWLEREIERRAQLVRDRIRDDHATRFSESDFEAWVGLNTDFARRRAAIVRAQLQGQR